MAYPTALSYTALETTEKFNIVEYNNRFSDVQSYINSLISDRTDLLSKTNKISVDSNGNATYTGTCTYATYLGNNSNKYSYTTLNNKISKLSSDGATYSGKADTAGTADNATYAANIGSSADNISYSSAKTKLGKISLDGSNNATFTGAVSGKSTTSGTADKAIAANITTSTGDIAYYSDTKGTFASSTKGNTANALINALTTGDANPQDDDYYVAQYSGGGTTTTSYHRRKHSALADYIYNKFGLYALFGPVKATFEVSFYHWTNGILEIFPKVLPRYNMSVKYCSITRVISTPGGSMANISVSLFSYNDELKKWILQLTPSSNSGGSSEISTKPHRVEITVSIGY